MPLDWVDITESDLEECLAIAPMQRGYELVGEIGALRAWKDLLRQPFFVTGALVRRGEWRQIVGFGAACMVSPLFAEAELANPRPGSNARFIETFAAGEPILLNRAQVACGNAGEGVDVLQLYGTLRDDLSCDEQFEAAPLMWAKFSSFLSGHRVKTVMSEVISDSDRRFTRGSGVRLIEFAEQNRFFACATRSSVAEVPSSAGMGVFTYTEPVLCLRETDQELLLAALEGVTDQDIGSMLGITQNAVKARWRSALARIVDVRPDLVTLDDRQEGRGPQKRHRVLAYIRAHPEELRPYDWRIRDTRR